MPASVIGSRYDSGDNRLMPSPKLNVFVPRSAMGKLVCPCRSSVCQHPAVKLPDGTYRHRRKSINAPGHAHELTFSCFRKLPLLSRDRSRWWLIDALDRARERHDLAILAYVIMPNHAHAIVLARHEQYDMALMHKAIKQSVSRRAMRYLRRQAPEWLPRLAVQRADGRIERRFWLRGGGYDRNIVQPGTLFNSIEYLHKNPVRRGFVDQPIDWYWSSARWYAGSRDGPLSIDPIPSEFMG